MAVGEKYYHPAYSSPKHTQDDNHYARNYGDCILEDWLEEHYDEPGALFRLKYQYIEFTEEANIDLSIGTVVMVLNAYWTEESHCACFEVLVNERITHLGIFANRLDEVLERVG